MLKTSQKMRLARFACRAVLFARSRLGLGPEVVVRRHGIRWHLDLTEGIDLSIYLLGAFEPLTRMAYTRLISPGAYVIDIGANIGAHTLPLAHLVGNSGRVLAIEPTAFAYEKLCANAALNPELQPQIMAEQVYLVGTASDTMLLEANASWPMFALGSRDVLNQGLSKSTTGGHASTLDDLVKQAKFPRVDFIKIDVDGHERGVLTGGQKTLEKYRPRMIAELAPHEFSRESGDLEEIISLLRRLDYKLWDFSERHQWPLDAEKLRSVIPPGVSRNAIVIPQA
ncbi:MAG: FkbM family methyltransferase [Candidatus Riflebacteria bacterium]|nr:FkbM family methyltransferase [Candidatus Riflebacteria bacterium]